MSSKTRSAARIATASAAVLLLLLPASARAQSTWARWLPVCFPAPPGYCDSAFGSLAATTGGGYVIVGDRNPLRYLLPHGWAGRIDASGAGQWAGSLAPTGPSSTGLSAAEAAPSDGVLVVGQTTSNLYVGRLDPAGAALWQREIGRDWPYEERGTAVRATSDGGYVVAGASRTAGPWDALLLKVGDSGNVAWAVEGAWSALGGSGYGSGTIPNAVAQTSDGGYIVAGSKGYVDMPDLDSWMAKFDSSGVFQWQRAFGTGGDDWVSSVEATEDGGFALAGRWGCADPDCGTSSFWVAKATADGALEWQSTYPLGLQDHAASIRNAIGGGFVVTGVTLAASSNGNPHALTLKLDGDGAIVWARVHGYPQDYEKPFGIVTSPDGDYVIGGLSNAGEFFLKLHADGSFDDSCLFASTPTIVPQSTAAMPVDGPASFSFVSLPVNPALASFGSGPADSFFRCPLHILPPASYQRIAAPILLEGANITPGSVLKMYVATATGPIDVFPDGLAPAEATFDHWLGSLPATVPLGNGFASLFVVATDRNFESSNLVGTVIIGNPEVGVPSLTSIDGFPLSPTSSEPGIATANVESVLLPGTDITIGGDGLDNPVANLFAAGGVNVGPLFPSAQDATSLTIHLPSNAPIGPGALQVVNLTSFQVSNAVSIPIGETIRVDQVAVGPDGVHIGVTGAGFNVSTVINFFAFSTLYGAPTLSNWGGLNPDGSARLPLIVPNSHYLVFTRPSGLNPGPAYVQALNPPFIPFTSSGNDPGGAFMLP